MLTKIWQFFHFKPLNTLTILRLFALTGVFSIAIFPAVYFALEANNLTTVIYSHTFADFAETASFFFAKNAYTGDFGIRTIYSPLAYIVVMPFALIAKNQIEDYLSGEIDLAELSQTTEIRISSSLFFIFWTILICLLLLKVFGFRGEKKLYLIVIVITFAPIVHCLFRGNTVIVSTFFSLVFCAFYRSHNRWAKEIALISLGLATAIKIFPAFLALALIKEKKLMPIIRAGIYSLLFYFVPFAFANGGFSNLAFLWQNAVDFLYKVNGFEWTNLSFTNYFRVLHYIFDSIIGESSTSIIIEIASWTVILCYLCLVVVSALAFKGGKRKAPFLIVVIGAVLFVPGVSYFYNASVLIFAYLVFAQEIGLYSKNDRIFYCTCFLLMAFYPFNTYIWFSPIGIITLIMSFKAMYDVYKDGINQRKLEQKFL